MSRAWPINLNVFTDDDSAPRIPYSTQACDLPATFPSSNGTTTASESHADPDKSRPNYDFDLESNSPSDGD